MFMYVEVIIHANVQSSLGFLKAFFFILINLQFFISSQRKKDKPCDSAECPCIADIYTCGEDKKCQCAVSDR